ncbi:MAG: DUF1080 domain-containing protein [Opitutaceae bacterium]|jgi:hypothetical protein|nr:DUF1080 domain-containing protein [Opitutaceae bacterium]
MRITPLLAALCLTLVSGAACFAGHHETIKVFNGKNLDGWVVEGGGQFSVEKGVIKLNRGTGWLRSADTFGDFVMVMEFRFLEDGANSGIFVRTSKTSNAEEGLWPTSRYQVQCMNNLEGNNPLGYIFPHNVPEVQFLYDAAAVKAAYKPTGEWLRYEITVRGSTLATKLNGKLINSVTDISTPSGHIGIQGEDGLLEFRKIEVTPIK